VSAGADIAPPTKELGKRCLECIVRFRNYIVATPISISNTHDSIGECKEYIKNKKEIFARVKMSL